MKTQVSSALVLVLVLVTCVAWTVFAQGPQPLQAAPQAEPPGPPPGPVWDGKPFPGESVLFQAAGDNPQPETRPSSSVLATNIPAVNLGQPGLTFRYVRTFGETLVPYLADNNHLFRPWGVAVDSSGNVYITEGSGQRMMKFSSGGNFLMSIGQAGVWIANNTNRIAGPRGVAVDTSGNIWIVEGGSCRVSKWDTTGKYVGQLGQTWNPGADNSRFRSPTGIALDGAQRVYIGDGNNNRVQVFDGAGNYVATIGTGSCGTANNQFCYPMGLAVDGASRLYVADHHNHRIQIFDDHGSYLSTLGTTGTCGQSSNQLCYPSGIAIDSDGQVYVSDSGNHRVQVFSPYPALSYVATLGVTGQWGSDNAHFGWPIGIAVDTGGNIYVAEEDNSRVQKFDRNRNYVRTFGVTGVPYLTDQVHFMNPTDVAIDSAGNLIVLEKDGQRFVKLDRNGVPLFSVGDPGNPSWSETGFCWPNAIATDRTGWIYLANTCNNRIQIYDADGAYLATVGTGYGTGNFQFNGPQGIAVSDNGYLYIADTGNHRIQVYDRNYNHVATIGQTGVAGTDNAHFDHPMRLAVDQAGNIYVPDANNFRVQKCTLAGICTTFAGTTGVSGSDFDHFSEPDGVAVDRQGRVYVVDQHNGRVQVYDQTGAYLTTLGGARGTATGQNQNPMAVKVDGDGNVYIVDQSNHRIQKFAPGVPGWRQVNINGFGDRTNFTTNSMAAFGNQLYVGTFNYSGNGAQLWRKQEATPWVPITMNGFGETANIGISYLIEFKGKLYAGVRNSSGGQLWRSDDGAHWNQVIAGGFGDASHAEIYHLTVFSETLYAFTRSYTATHGFEIWRSATGASSDWERVMSNGFGDARNQDAPSSAVFNGRLYVGTNNWNQSNNTAGGGQVWRTANGIDWEQVNTPGFGNTSNQIIGSLVVYGDYLYAGTQSPQPWLAENPGDGQIWRCQACDGTDWNPVVTNGFGDANNNSIHALAVFRGRLYAVTCNYITGMEVWQSTDGVIWTPVSPDGFGDSNNTAPYWANSVIQLNNHLYIGTSNGANGAELWVKTVTADFSASPTVGRPGTMVTFTNLSSGDVMTATWNFGDGSAPLVSNASVVQHAYSAPGVYTVTLTVSDGVDTDVKVCPACIQIAHRLFLPLVLRH